MASALAAGGADRSGPAALTFLLRRYAASGRGDLRASIEEGLARALDAVQEERDPLRRCEWVELLLYAAGMSDDDRIDQAVRAAVPALVDDLEAIVRARYEPGDGLLDGDLAAHARLGGALLTAFSLSGPLPYAMLAEELLRFARRTWWDDVRGAFTGDVPANCAAARLCSRLAQLHDDPEYVRSAIIAADADYARDAARVLESIDSTGIVDAAQRAAYGLALLDWFALRSAPLMDRASLVSALTNVATRLRVA